MAGVDVSGGAGCGRRKSVDSEINMIPMIDLLMVTISFLLITAVWAHMSRLSSDAQVPGPPTGESPPAAPEKQLHVLMLSPDRFVLAWKQGPTTLESKGSHANPRDPKLDEAVLHAESDTDFKTIVGVIDAIYAPHREMATSHRTAKVPAFNLTFAVN